MSWKPDWEVEPAPCEEPGTCTPEKVTCESCIRGKALFTSEKPFADWTELAEWQREAWRREASS